MTNTREIKSLTCYLVSQYHQANGHQSTILTEKESLQYQSLIGSLISTSSIKTKDEKISLLERIIESFLEMSTTKSRLELEKRRERITSIDAVSFSLKSPKRQSTDKVAIKNQNTKTHTDLQKEQWTSPRTKRIERAHSRPFSAACPKLKGNLLRPKTASPKFHRHKIQVRAPLSDGKQRSKENWIPEEFRQKMLKRDLAVAMVNLEAKETCNITIKHMTQRNTDLLERSLSMEKFGIEQRRPCGLCCIKFLPVNLILAVPLKAVLDIRDSWGNKFDPEGRHRVRVNPNMRKAPGCYNSIRVCAFCAQLFDKQQDTYRPSFEAKEAEKQRLRSLQEEAKTKVENDPLSQIDKERDAEVHELSKSIDAKR